MQYQKFLSVFLLFATSVAATCAAAEPLDIGSRRELFVDDYIIERLGGDAERRLHKPVPHDVVLVTDAPWEGNTSAYYTVFRDGDLYRMYYRGSHFDETERKSAHREVTCYAESRDGIHWTKPELGLFEFEGSTANNIVWDGIGTHCFTVFKDANPNCRPDAKYKAISRGRPRGEKGLYVFKSADGIHWSLMHSEPVITRGDFDSQNLAFWDGARGVYAEYHRKSRDGKRDVMTSTSDDFLHWTQPAFLEYPGSPKEHLYTNAVLPYERAPHILIGFPTRFLPDEGQRVEPTFMSSRDGRTFHRWTEALIPEDAPSDRAGNRSNYMTWGMVQLPDDDRKYSVYATEAYYTGPDSRVRRFSYRVDGFVSVRATDFGGELLTRPLTFDGNELSINSQTGDEGAIRVEIQKSDGTAIEGFALDDCRPIRGDAIDRTVEWQRGSDVGRLAGKPVRLRFQLRNADLYSFRFGPAR